MLRRIKIGALTLAHRTGITELIGDSAWRRRRLLILCYHGVTDGSEHLWAPGFYMDLATFRSRMEYLRTTGCHALSLSEALERLHRGCLPERSVCVTFDDGWRDFYRIAAPVLRSLAIPATVYLTTYYVSFNRPVFDPMLSYLLWRAAGRIVQFDGIVQQPVILDSTGRSRVERAVRQFVRNEQLGASAKDALLERLAARLGVDYGVLLRERILHLMNEHEVQQSAEAGFSIQSHTHRHRISRDERLFLKELDDNRDRILALAGVAPEHFCYPGGNYLSEYGELLRRWGARSATTCDPGLACPGDDVYFLARHLDSNTKTHEEFAAWVCGLAALLPRRVYPPTPGQFLEDWTPSGKISADRG